MACSSTGANDRRRNQYAKIIGLDRLTGRFAAFGEKQGVPGLKEAVDQAFGTVPAGDFMEVVDLDHPHAWLSRFMNLAEVRFAWVVVHLLNDHPEFLSDCQKMAYEDGKENTRASFETMEEAYRFYAENILDGMPCDDTREVLEVTGDRIAWKKKMELHEEYWIRAGGTADTYYLLRKAYVSGLFADSGITYSDENHVLFALSRSGREDV